MVKLGVKVTSVTTGNDSRGVSASPALSSGHASVSASEGADVLPGALVVVPFEIHRTHSSFAKAVNLDYDKAQAPYRQTLRPV